VSRTGRRRWLVGLALAVALCAIDVLWVLRYYTLVERFAAAHEFPETATADAAVVFFGSTRPDGGLDPDTELRVRRAAALYRTGRVRAMIAVGGARRGERPGSAVMAERLTELGVPDATISTDSRSYDSITNWEEALAIAGRRGLHSVVLVSAPTHLMRLRSIARGSGLTVAYAGWSDADLRVSAGERWRTAHRETAAYLASRALPRRWYLGLLRRVRGV
jgi:uncharacterized SAM-binding protein YcdF (DUF218 family)